MSKNWVALLGMNQPAKDLLTISLITLLIISAVFIRLGNMPSPPGSKPMLPG